MDIRYIKAKELSARWGVTPRRINQLCTEGKLPGAYKEGKFWMIPDDVDRPDCLRENRNLYVREDSVVYNRKRPCPVGITSYKEVSNECYYVDKTLLIRDIIDNHSRCIYLQDREDSERHLLWTWFAHFLKRLIRIHQYILKINIYGARVQHIRRSRGSTR